MVTIQEAQQQIQQSRQQVSAYKEQIGQARATTLSPQAIARTSGMAAYLQRQKTLGRLAGAETQTAEYEKQIAQSEGELQSYLSTDSGKLQYAKEQGLKPDRYEQWYSKETGPVQVPIYKTPYGEVKDETPIYEAQRSAANITAKELGFQSAAQMQQVAGGGLTFTASKEMNVGGSIIPIGTKINISPKGISATYPVESAVLKDIGVTKVTAPERFSQIIAKDINNQTSSIKNDFDVSSRPNLLVSGLSSIRSVASSVIGNSSDFIKAKEAIETSPVTGKPYGLVTAAPTKSEQYKALTQQQGYVKGTLSYLGEKLSGAYSSAENKLGLQGKPISSYQPEAISKALSVAPAVGAYAVPYVGTALMVAGGGETIYKAPTLGGKAMGVVEVGLGLFGIKAQANNLKVAAINRAVEEGRYTTVFKGTLENENLKVISATKVPGIEKPVMTLSKFEVQQPNTFTGVSIQRNIISPTKESLTGYETIAQTKEIQGIPKAVSVVETKLGKATTAEVIQAKPFISQSGSQNLGTIYYNPQKRLGMIDTIGTTAGEKIKLKQVGQDFSSKGTITTDKSAALVKIQEKISKNVQTPQGIITIKEKAPENVFEYISGPTKLRISKSSFFDRSLVFRRNIAGTIEVKSGTEQVGKGVVTELLQKAPISSIQKEIQANVKLAASKEVQQLENKIDLFGLAKVEGQAAKSIVREVSPTVEVITKPAQVIQVESKQVLATIPSTTTQQRIDNISSTVLGSATQTKQVSINEQSNIIDLKQGETSKLGVRDISLVSNISKSESKSQIKQSSTGENVLKTTPKPPIIPIKFKPSTKKKNSKIISDIIASKEFKVFVKQRGKDIEIGKARTESEAAQKLFRTLKTTLRASGYVETGGRRINLTRYLGGEFTPSKKEGVFRAVQQRGFRLGTGSERREIKAAKMTSRGKGFKWI